MGTRDLSLCLSLWISAISCLGKEEDSSEVLRLDEVLSDLVGHSQVGGSCGSWTEEQALSLSTQSRSVLLGNEWKVW